jgi:serine/threonine protein kinase
MHIYTGDEKSPVKTLDIKNARLQKVVLDYVCPRGKKLKHYGFELTSRDRCYYFFADSKIRQHKWIRALRKTCILFDIRSDYHIGSMIGSGGFGTVHVSQRKSTRGNYAIKIIDKAQIDSD